MKLEIVPLLEEHLGDAAELLAARQRTLHEREPHFPERFCEPAHARESLLEAFARERTSGVAALRDGRTVGYMFGSLPLPPPTSGLSLTMHPRSAIIPFAGAVAQAPEAVGIYRQMYAALAAVWVEQGFFGHYASIATTDRDAVEAWFSLGFGLDFARAVRSTSVPVEVRASAGLEIRQGGIEDIEIIFQMVLRNWYFHLYTPIFAPFLSEVIPDQRQYLESVLAEPSTMVWLAYMGGKPVGVQTYVAREVSLTVPEKSIHLHDGYTEPEARGMGVASALLAKGLESAREAGYERCTVAWMTANLLSSRFWQGSGFCPMTNRLCRIVDERIAWARPAV